jgi:hypothetical protein
MIARLALSSVVVLGLGCSKSATVKPPQPPAGVDTAALCADLDALVTAAPANFVDDRTETPVQRDHQDGVTAKRVVAGTMGCLVLVPDPGYSENMIECDLAAPSAKADAEAVLTAWQPKIAGCPVVKDWHLDPGPGAVQSWQFETTDNHLLEVQLELGGDEPNLRPVLRVRRPEI